MKQFIFLMVIAAFVCLGCGQSQKLKSTLKRIEENKTKIEKACDIASDIGSMAGNENVVYTADACTTAIDALNDAEKTTAGQMVLCCLDKPVEYCIDEIPWAEVAQKIRKNLK